MVEAWLAYSAWKVFGKPVWDNLCADGAEAATRKVEQIGASAWRGLVGQATDDPVGEVAPGTTDEAVLVEELAADPEATEAVGAELLHQLGLNLESPLAALPGVGSDGWWVSAYDAALWRVAMLVALESRPVAIGGALQGPNWVTVCTPRSRMKPGVLQPRDVWARPEARLLRRTNNGQVDFYVHRVTGNSSDELLNGLNTGFIQDLGAAFRPGDEAEPDSWFRVDQVTRKWVGLELDPQTQHDIEYRDAVQFPGGGWLGVRNLQARPPTYEDYPEAWHDVIDVHDEVTAISSLSQGADDYWSERSDLQKRAGSLLQAPRTA